MARAKFKVDRNGLQVNESANSVYVGVTKHVSAPEDRPWVAYASVPQNLMDDVREYSKTTGFYAGLANSILIDYFADERDAAFVAQDFRDPEYLEDNLQALAEDSYRFPDLPKWEYDPIDNAALKDASKVLNIESVGDALSYLIQTEAQHIVGLPNALKSAIRKLADKLSRTHDHMTAARLAIDELAPAS